MSDESTQFRRPSAQELHLLAQLVARASGVQLSPGWRDTLRVRPMADGGMGSLKLASEESLQSDRPIGRRAAELQFVDADGIPVLVSLNVDRDGHLLELDMWKTDFSSLIRIPDEFPNDPSEDTH
jgi:hypothetical protein